MLALVETHPVDPRLIASYVGAAAFDVLMPIAVVLFLRRKLKTPWLVFGVGALAFLVSQMFTRIPLIAIATGLLQKQLDHPVIKWGWLAVLALTAGLFEETARYLCFRFVLPKSRDWKTAVSLGAGHGGVESAVLVALAVVGSLVTLLMVARGTFPESSIPADKLAAWQAQKATLLSTAWWMPLLGAWERVCSLSFHVAASVIVLQRFVRGKMSWYWGAVLFHALVDAMAVVLLKLTGPISVELALTGLLVIDLVIIFSLRPRSSEVAAAPALP